METEQKIIQLNEARDAGLKHYFTGKPCKHGHIAKRLVSNKGCNECNRITSNYYSRLTYRKSKENGKLASYLQATRDKRLEQRRDAYRANPERKRAKDLEVKYGITNVQYEAMFQAQGGCCALCEKPERTKDAKSGKPRQLAVDHQHATNKVRGLLCSHCNRAIGLFGDDPGLITKAAEYIRRHT